MKRFNIVTLSSKHSRLADPVTVITAGVSILSQLFPNIFGGARKQLTESDWLQLIPGAGFYTTQLRNYLKTRIKYDVDFTNNVLPFSQQFSFNMRDAGGFCNGCSNDAAYQKLLSVLDKEKSTGGTSPIGITPGGYGLTTDWSSLIPLAIGGVVLVLAMKTKKKRK